MTRLYSVRDLVATGAADMRTIIRLVAGGALEPAGAIRLNPNNAIAGFRLGDLETLLEGLR
ncbi:hypothetical protein [Gordonia tangerina]|uniref:Uncharacterized protein n=1 Tax=Gordonia tangerina TaxID=2911060 RepID=A0ABS9DJF7_9ACTN|nr:hypothetical protein [Gordonia tangerina]MCF3938385.1 hypothetical protein [Gordonia tangerina]